MPAEGLILVPCAMSAQHLPHLYVGPGDSIMSTVKDTWPKGPPLNENRDGEVDENFWAQAAADQAAGLATSADEGGFFSPLPFSRRL